MMRNRSRRHPADLRLERNARRRASYAERTRTVGNQSENQRIEVQEEGLINAVYLDIGDLSTECPHCKAVKFELNLTASVFPLRRNCNNLKFPRGWSPG